MTHVALCTWLIASLPTVMTDAVQVTTGASIAQAMEFVGRDASAASEFLFEEFYGRDDLNDAQIRTLSTAIGVISLVYGVECAD